MIINPHSKKTIKPQDNYFHPQFMVGLFNLYDNQHLLMIINYINNGGKPMQNLSSNDI